MPCNVGLGGVGGPYIPENSREWGGWRRTMSTLRCPSRGLELYVFAHIGMVSQIQRLFRYERKPAAIPRGSIVDTQNELTSARGLFVAL